MSVELRYYGFPTSTVAHKQEVRPRRIGSTSTSKATAPRASRGGSRPLGGRISPSNVPGMMEAEQRRAGHIPGPGSYNLAPTQVNVAYRGPRFATGASPDDVDRLVLRAQQMPGPQDYRLPPVTNAGRQVVFGRAPSREDEARMMRIAAAELPGPGAYDTATRGSWGTKCITCLVAYRYLGGRFILMRSTEDTKYIPMTWARRRTTL